MKNILLSFILSLAGVLPLAAAQERACAGLSQADALYEKGLFDKAADCYENAAKSEAGDGRLRAVYRAIESRALTFAYGEAAQRLLSEPLPKQGVWRARYLLLKAELFRQYLSQYGYGLPSDRQEGSTDVTKWTAAQWHQEIAAAYGLLWPLRASLQAVSLEDEAYFVRKGQPPSEDFPTLWDFAVYRWTDYLLGQAPVGEALPSADEFVSSEYAERVDFAAPPARLAAALMSDASGSQGGKIRRRAAEVWKLKRLMIPFEHSDKVRRSADASLLRDAAVKVLRGWMEVFSVPDNRAAAAAQAAAFLEQAGKYGEAAELCQRADSLWHGTPGAKVCASLLARMEMPSLSLTAHNAPPGGKRALSLNVRNLEKVYCRIYKTSQQELLALARRGGGERDYSHLLYMSNDALLAFLERRPDIEWTLKPDYPAVHQALSVDADAPGLEPGLYVAVVSGDNSFKPGSDIVQAGIVNCTELFLLGSAGFMSKPAEFFFDPRLGQRTVSADGFHLYAVNSLTGRPVNRAAVRAFYGTDYSSRKQLAFNTDAYGMAEVKTPFSLNYPVGLNYSLSPLAEQGGSLAYWQNEANFGYSVPAPLEIYLETDRPIYRPGQKVGFKATVLRRTADGYAVSDSPLEVRITVRDANYMEFHSVVLKPNGMGSVSGSFKIPEGRLLGGYMLEAAVDAFGSSFTGSAGFGVEEYKRPEFELKLAEAKEPWRCGRKASVQGQALYYFGGAVPQAKVSYKIYRQRFVPWYWRWYFWEDIGGSKTEVDSGSVVAGEDGRFAVEFTPEAELGKDAAVPYSFIVEAEARDAGGRTITDSKTYRAGDKAYLFKVDMPAGFANPQEVYDVAVRLMNLNDAQVQGRGSFALYKLSPEADDDGIYGGGGYWGRISQSGLEQRFKDIPNGAKVQSGDFLFGEVGAEHVRLKQPAEGVYRLELKADDPWGGENAQSFIIVSAGKHPKLALPSVAIPEHKSYQVGETARILAGSSELKGVFYAEIWAGQFLLGRQVFKEGGLHMLEIPVAPEHRGGFAVRWFGASDFKIYSGEALVEVPRPEKELTVSLDAPKAMEPGAQARWTLSVKDKDGKPADGEALVKVYDRSLEYYAGGGGSWLDELYRDNGSATGLNLPFFNSSTASLPVKEGIVKRLWDAMHSRDRQPQPPYLALVSSRHSRRRFHGGDGELMSLSKFDMVRSKSAAPVMAEAMSDSAVATMPQSAAEGNFGGGAGGGGAAPASKQQVRSDFSETAYFQPQLSVKKGTGKISFKMPERLTGWQVAVTALTGDVKRGKLSAQVQTRKDFMVRLEMPRFFREGDKGVIKALVHNETDVPLKTSVVLQLEQDGQNALAAFGVKDAQLAVELKPGEIQTAQWEISAPRGVAVYKARALARSGRYTDAEEKDIPVLASRQRLVASQLKSLDGTAKTELSLEELQGADSSRVVESLHLQVDPQLALSILNSLPFLVHYPYECTEQLVNRYVPLAIVNQIYGKYPALAEAAKKIPSRNTVTPAWERDNPARMTALLETPWEEISRGRKAYWPVTDMLKPAVVAQERRAALDKLSSYQLENGAFPWFPGGREDLYMTLYALEGFAQARSYGVEIPVEAVRKAIAFVNAEMPGRIKPDEEPLSLMLYASYVLTSFPKKWPESAASYANARTWLSYAEQHANAMTAYGKAHAAMAWAKLGDKKRSDSYLDRALDGAKTDPIAGVYWTPEKISWLWYNDTVEKHAFMLRALAVLRPQDAKIGGLVQWLLFNRKGNEWKSTRASAAAIYSLLEVLKARGALDKGDVYAINWGAQDIEAKVEPQDWLETPLRWSRYGADAAPVAYAKAAISKTGPGLAFVSLTGIYSTEQLAQNSPDGMMNVRRAYFLRVKKGKEYALLPIKSGDTVSVGDQIEVHLTVSSRSQFEYVQLKDPKAAGFEAETLNSGWQWDLLSRYEEPRDSFSNFFVPWLPHGEYALKYRLRPTTPGTYRVGAAVLQSLYAPEFAAHSDGMIINVK